MKLSEVIAHVGDDHVEFQDLGADMVEWQRKKDGAKVSFMTDPAKSQDVAAGRGKWLGLVVWIETSRLPESVRAVVQGAWPEGVDSDDGGEDCQ